MLAIFNLMFLQTYQGANVSSVALVEIIGCKYGSIVTNNMTFVFVGK